MLHLIVFLSYSLLSLAFLHRLLPVWGSMIPGGLQDTRLFLWNAWWFRHAVDVLHTHPFFTRLLFHPFGSSLVSHDYPLWMSGVTYTAQNAGLNLIASSNIWFILSWILAGLCSYLLVWEVVRARGPALVAGLYVMTHNYTLARAMQNWGQFNLWGIALFLWLFVRARRLGRTQDYALAGAALAWTAACHYYFLIYCGAIWLAVVAADLFPVRLHVERGGHPKVQRFFMGMAMGSGLIAGWILRHPGEIAIGSNVISLTTPANALLIMWLALFGWFAGRYTWRLERCAAPVCPMTRNAILALTALICLSPLLIAAVKLALAGDYPRQHILWKTPPMGVDLIGLFTPNPLNAWWGPGVTRWLTAHNIYPEEQAGGGIGWVCLGILIWSRRASPTASGGPLSPAGRGVGGKAGRWLMLAVSATVLSLGSYLHIFQWNTWMPLPFYVWRLLPVLGNVRLPERWMAVGAIAWSVVLALAMIMLARKKGWPLNRVCLLAGALILLENWPGIPLGSPPQSHPVYERLRTLPVGGVLPLPLYIGDSSRGSGQGQRVLDQMGSQIYHQQPMLGGYIGRVSLELIKKYETDPFFGRLLNLEEGESVEALSLSTGRACKSILDFEANYILMYPKALNASTLAFVKNSLPLSLLVREEGIELHRIDCQKTHK